MDIPVLPFWKNVPEKFPGLPENSIFSKQFLIVSNLFRTTTGVLPTNKEKTSPNFLDNFVNDLLRFLTFTYRRLPTKGKFVGPGGNFFGLKNQKDIIAFICSSTLKMTL